MKKIKIVERINHLLLPPGIYFAQMKSKKTAMTKKSSIVIAIPNESQSF